MYRSSVCLCKAQAQWAISGSAFTNAGTAAGIINNASTTNNLEIKAGVQPYAKITIRPDGKIGIGNVAFPASSSYRLFVEGNIACRELKVQATGWPDYVFADNYKLLSIADLEAFVLTHKHLPNVPSAEQINKNEGVEVGDMQKILLQKIEEQTLYIIDLQHQINDLKKRIP